MIRAFALTACLLPLSLQAEVYPALHAVTGVAADDVLNIRAAPDAGSPVIGSLAPDATGIEVIAQEGDWAVVNTAERSGYVAARFLARSDAADWGSLTVPLTCLGTEPFWSLEIDPDARLTRLQSPEMPEPMPSSMTEIWPAGPWAPTAALSLQQGIGILEPKACSDGMSDRSYGIAIDIFRVSEDPARLTGCCRLGLQ